MINHARESFLETTGLDVEADSTFIRSARELATCEANFEPVCGRTFDGACRVDVVVRLRPGMAAAFELKLGTTRLTKSRVDGEWLPPCLPSHGGRRWRGNVMAVLERRFLGATVDTLSVRTTNERLTLIHPWFLVARGSVLRAWKGDPPSFSSAVRQVAFEDIVSSFGNAEAFNRLVQGMLDIDFYNEWVASDPDAGI